MAGLNSVSIALEGIGIFDPPHMALQGIVVALAVDTRRTVTRRDETVPEETRTFREDDDA
jgi:hypothetical protein